MYASSHPPTELHRLCFHLRTLHTPITVRRHDCSRWMWRNSSSLWDYASQINAGTTCPPPPPPPQIHATLGLGDSLLHSFWVRFAQFFALLWGAERKSREWFNNYAQAAPGTPEACEFLLSPLSHTCFRVLGFGFRVWGFKVSSLGFRI